LHIANLGAYVGAVGANIPTLSFARCLPALYDIKHIDISARCAFANTIATAPYRGADRPEANYVLERLVEEAARVTGLDPAKLRQRNLIPASAMPYKTAVGTVYDSGDFRPIFDKALALADYDGFKRRRRDAKKRGRYRGIGISCMLEHAGGTPRG
jgi:aerobic carbon-monoxide dehydrogenase large subunit